MMVSMNGKTELRALWLFFLRESQNLCKLMIPTLDMFGSDAQANFS